MLDAKSAREMSMTADKEISDKQLEYIECKITKACNDGHTSVNLKGTFQSTTAKRLEDLGYVVKFFDDQRDGAWTTISW